MYCPDERLILAKLNGTHDLALNMFSADKPQLILLTLDSYRRQHEPLDADDFAAALEVLRKFDSMYVIYNCTETGGCSRIHKHLQALKGPPKAFEVLMQQPENGASKVPFQYFTHQFDQDFKATSASDLRVVHEKLLGQAKRVLGIPESSGICPHNLVLWRDTMIVIPRRSGAFEGATANAAGMMGSVWVPEPKGLDAWKRLGPRNILQEFGVPLP
jgi:ATP adenylyltransferase